MDVSDAAGAHGGAERRAFPRLEVDTEVIVEGEAASHRCRVVDVAPGGARLHPAAPGMAVGQRVRVIVAGTPLTAEASVLRIDADSMAVRFVTDALGAVVAGWAAGLDAHPRG